MAGYTNFVENTSFPVDEQAADQMSADAKQRKFFDNYYTKVGSVDPAQYDKWKANHKCSFNYFGSVNRMELEGEKPIFGGSLS